MNRDPGLQAERTLLAWTRTALVLGVDAALILRTGVVRHQPGLTALGVLLATAAGGFYRHGMRLNRRLQQVGAGSVAGRAAPLRALAVVVAVVAAGSAWCVLAGPPPR